MPTYCVPALSGVPGSSATEFEWWTTPPDGSLRYYPENPNWLGAFSLSQGVGANRHLHFRALRGGVAGQPYLFLSWVMRVSAMQPGIDHLNVVLGDGTNYVAFQVLLETAASTVAGRQDGPSPAYSYQVHSCSVGASGEITVNNPALAVDGAALETTGRMWVDVASTQRLLESKWAFQLAIPLGVVWSPTALNLPVSGAFKLWYAAWASISTSHTTMYPPMEWAEDRDIEFDVAPADLRLSDFLDMSTGSSGCTPGVTLEWGNVGVRNPDGSSRPSPSQIRLDLGQDYPPNLAVGGGPSYDESHTPNVSAPQFQNQFFARPTLPPGLSTAQQEALRARFSLANWGSQYSTPTASSWRPVPGGEDTNFMTAGAEMRFVWPAGAAADAYTTTLVRNINRYLNAVAAGGSIPAGAQNPHQCMLVELSSTDPTVVITRSSIYQNMDIVDASVFRRHAEISVVGLDPIAPTARDVYLYLQTFNMPKVVKGQGGTSPIRGPREGFAAGRPSSSNEVEDVAAVQPTYVVHAYHDTGKELTLRDGRRVGILRPQTSFGYFVRHEGDLHGWETRIYGAEKIADDLYRVAVPNNGSVYVETAIQARESASVTPLPPDGARADWCTRLADRLESMGILGRLLAMIVRFICRLLGRA